MNAKQEFEWLMANHVVKCAAIVHDAYTAYQKHIKLRVGYSDEDMKKFLKELNFEYDAGYGGQELYGMVWFEGGAWATRGEYDGSEWWQIHTLPEIPETLADPTLEKVSSELIDTYGEQSE